MLCDFDPSYYERLITPYKDSYQLIVQKDLDGGDTAHRIGIYYLGLYLIFKENTVYLQKIKNDFKNDLNKIKIGSGEFVRHPDKSKWYSNPKNFSRDQTTPLIIAMGFFDEKKDIKSNLVSLLLNFGFYPNDLKNWSNEQKTFPNDFNDIASPVDFGHYIRALNYEKLKLFLYFSDSVLLANSLIRIFFSYYDKTDTSDDLNFSLSLIQAKEKFPTFISNFATKIYFKYKKNSEKPYPNYKEENPIQSAWDYYFREESLAPPLNKIYRCIIPKYFN